MECKVKIIEFDDATSTWTKATLFMNDNASS